MALPTISLDIWSIPPTPLHPAMSSASPRTGQEFDSAVELFLWLSGDLEQRDNPARTVFERTIARSEPFKTWVRNRPLIKSLPYFRQYRPSTGSRRYNAAALRLAVGTALLTDRDMVLGLQHEIARCGFFVPPRQLLFSGKSYAGPLAGRHRFNSFLSTSLCPGVAACHARDHSFHHKERGYVWVIRTTTPLPAIFAPAGKFREYEVLASTGIEVDIERIERCQGGLFDVIVARQI